MTTSLLAKNGPWSMFCDPGCIPTRDTNSIHVKVNFSMFTSQIYQEPFQETFPTFFDWQKITHLTLRRFKVQINSTKATKIMANNQRLEITWVHKNLPPKTKIMPAPSKISIRNREPCLFGSQKERVEDY